MSWIPRPGQGAATSPCGSASHTGVAHSPAPAQLAGPSDYNNVQDISGALGVTLWPDFRDRRAVTWVGLGGLEPPTSSLSGKADPQANRDAGDLTSTFTPQHPPAHPAGLGLLTHG